MTFFESEAAGLNGPGFRWDLVSPTLVGARAADASRSRRGDLPLPLE